MWHTSSTDCRTNLREANSFFTSLSSVGEPTAYIQTQEVVRSKPFLTKTSILDADCYIS